mgnify:CR=1 FL=1
MTNEGKVKAVNQKLWVGGMVGGNREILEESIGHIHSYFDGLIFVVDSRAKQEDIDWLESIKKEGKIIVKKWVNDHAHTSNEVMLSGIMEFPDYIVWLDQSDKLNEVFVKRLRENIKYWHQNNVGMVYLDHPFIIRYHQGVRFANSPHWTIINTIGKSINLSTINGYRKENYIFNLRDNDKLRSGFLSPAKYWFCYPPFSNQTQLLYSQFSNEIWSQHEQLRINFQFYCKYELGLELTLESLIDYMQNNVGKYSDYFEKVLETEVNLLDLFRLYVLNQKWEVLAENRFNFSYFRWKNEGIVDQGKYDSYIGCFNRYRLQQNKEIE